MSVRLLAGAGVGIMRGRLGEAACDVGEGVQEGEGEVARGT